jgi:5-methylcytosine-specific restriction endonuclease McrA
MPRDYKKEYQNYQGTEEQKKNRAVRNAARRDAMEAGKVQKGDGMDIDHRVPISKGGSNSSNNLRARPKSENRSFPRTRTGRMK